MRCLACATLGFANISAPMLNLDFAQHFFFIRTNGVSQPQAEIARCMILFTFS